MASGLTDLGLALRSIRRRPALSAAVVLPIGPAIAVNTALFSVMDGLLFRPLPFEKPDELVAIEWRRVGDSLPDVAFLPWLKPERERLCAALENSPLVAGATQAGNAAGLRGAREMGLQVTGVDSRFFRLLGLTPLLGTDFTPEDEPSSAQVAASHVPVPVIIDHGVWQREFGGDRAVLGVREIGGERVRIVGVMGPGVKFPGETNVWFPVSSRRAFPPAYARLAPGATLEQLASRFPLFEIAPLADAIRPDGGRTMVMLFGAACLLLLVAWVQVGALVFAGTVGRLHEFGVRLALGAGRLRVVRELAVEYAVLAGTAFTLAWFAARPLAGLVVNMLPADLSLGQYLDPDARTFAFGCLASLVGLGLLTALPIAVIRNALPMRLLQGHIGRLPFRTERVRQVLVVAQVMLTTLLLYLAGLMVHSFMQAATYEYGFDSTNVVLFTPPLPSVPPGTKPKFAPRCNGGPCGENELLFHAALEERQRKVGESLGVLREVPGVIAAASFFCLPLVKEGLRPYTMEAGSPDLFRDEVVQLDGRPLVPALRTSVNAASREFVRALGALLVSGSSFDDPQFAGMENVAIVNESLARRLSPALSIKGIELSPPLLGHTIATQNERGRVFRIIGVIKDLVYGSPAEPSMPQLYFPVSLKAMGGVLAIRTTPSVDTASPAIRTALQRVWGDDLPPKHFTLLRDAWHAGLLPFRGKALLLSLVAVLCLPLAAVGVTGAMLYSVQVRTRETAIRIALGADPRTVRRAVVRRATAIVAAGLAIGTVLGVAAGRAISSQLFNVQTVDVWTMIGVTASLLGLAWVAALVPARRASRIEPAVALRSD